MAYGARVTFIATEFPSVDEFGDDSGYDYVPYSERMPRTDDLHVLREELSLQRELHGRSSSQALEAFQNLFRTSCRVGRPLDGLRQFSTDEVERFFAQIRHGTDGHVYWTGTTHGFALNERGARGRRKYARPNRWWWMRINGTADQYHDIFPECGQKGCINPEHQAHGRDERRRIYTHEQMIGAIQAMALRLGRAPTKADWAKQGGRPTSRVYAQRFGSWVDALVMAGVIKSRSDIPRIPPPMTNVSPERCIESLREARRFLGTIPRERQYAKYKPLRDHLVGLELVSSQTTIKKYLGGRWPEALEKAFGK